MAIQNMSVQELASRLTAGNACVLDVREPWEVGTACICNALAIPMNDVPDRLDELRAASDGKDLVVMCHSGQRSGVITRFLNQAGFDRVFNLDGGIEAWSQEIDPSVPSY
ncbi:MAG: rhodanese-like domain-containing protein [Gammaproteobacteria bacterium]|nr:rhodanese-like domain-containing protein [Gammaproteobacteria bacterium]MDH3767288.1 rhodanese-like domain-containing protein [Gammaproteobacteria bacterium]